MPRAPFLLLLPVLAGCGMLFGRFHTPNVIEGAVTTREPMTPLPGSRVHVVLTPADSSRLVIAETTLTAPPRIPFTYQLRYDPARIRQRQTYVVRASLTEGETVRLATNAPVPVITVGSGRTADLVLTPPPKRIQVDTTRAMTAAQPTSAALSGTITYRERRALPFGAVVTVELVHLLRPDMPEVVSTAVVRTRGEQVPIPFTLSFAADRIAPRDRYGLRARIQIGGRTLYRTRGPTSVLTYDAPTDRVEVFVEERPADSTAAR